MKDKEPEQKRRYFDWAASAMPDTACFTSSATAPFPFGNPSSLHREGRAARDALENARRRCAAVLGVPPQTLYFTSGGTEANCIVLHSFLAHQSRGRIIASEGEHSSIAKNLQMLERNGKPVGRIPVDSSGRVTADLLSKTLEKYGDTRYAAIMAVNNEIGTINDMAALNDILRNRDGPPIHLHCDTVQAVGKIPLDIALSGLDSASVSSHKIGGPRGIGLLYLRRPLEVLCSGGGQENNIRPGTENVSGALALAACLEKHAQMQNLAAEHEQARQRCKKLLEAFASIDRCRIIPLQREPDDKRFSPYIMQAAFADIPGEVMVRALDDLGFAVSTGSACTSATPERPVLAAMGIADNVSLEGIRISQGWSTTDEEIDLLADAVREVLKFL